MNEELFLRIWAQVAGTDHHVSEWPVKVRARAREFENAYWRHFSRGVAITIPGAPTQPVWQVIDMSFEVQMPLKSIMFYIGSSLNGGWSPWSIYAGGLFP